MASFVPSAHLVLKTPLKPPFPEDTEEIFFGMGCFWGAERRFWRREGVYTTSVGYAGGESEDPTYEEVCAGGTGHVEVVRVVYHPSQVSLEELLTVFWESHDPTQGMRQGADIGEQYRSAIYTFSPEQLPLLRARLVSYEGALKAKGFGPITTEIRQIDSYTFAEAYHQQYLARNPNGYCGLRGTGVRCT